MLMRSMKNYIENLEMAKEGTERELLSKITEFGVGTVKSRCLSAFSVQASRIV